VDIIDKIISISNGLSDKTRFKILKLIIKSGEISCKRITAIIKLSQPAISHHLKTLIDSGLVITRREGQWGHFSLNKKVFKEYLNGLRKEVMVKYTVPISLEKRRRIK
jgi:ArsR family transcriptional regulator